MMNRNPIGWSMMILSALAVPALAAAGPISPWGRVADMKLARGYHTLTPLSGNRILARRGAPRAARRAHRRPDGGWPRPRCRWLQRPRPARHRRDLRPPHGSVERRALPGLGPLQARHGRC